MIKQEIESTCDNCGVKKKGYMKQMTLSYWDEDGWGLFHKRGRSFDICDKCIKEINFKTSALKKIVEFFKNGKIFKK
jgi:hypothetical protein